MLFYFLGVITLSSCAEREDFKFERGVKQVYESIYYDSLDKVICKEQIDFIGTRENTHFSDKQEKIFYNFHISSVDSANFVERPRMYKDFTYSRSWQKTFGQGIIHDQNGLWMHPLRANQYRFTQDCPFPHVRFPLAVGNQWNGGVSRGTDFKTKVLSEYKVVKKDSFKGKIGSLKNCWYINSKSSFGEIEHKLNMIYHEKFGFVKFEYLLHNGDRVEIELIGQEKVTEADYALYEKRDERNR